MDLAMDTNSDKTINGIVVGQLSPTQFFVWCQESYPGKDGVLTTNPEHPVLLGDWVSLKFSKTQADLYFPNPKNADAPPFKTSEYSVIPDIYRTDAAIIIRVTLLQKLKENQEEIDHSVFGKIYNNNKLEFADGMYYLTIKRIKVENNRDSEWVLEKVKEVPEEPPEVVVTGIVAAVDNKNKDLLYVWCEERLPGQDITIKMRSGSPSLPLGTWVKMKLKLKLKIDDPDKKEIFHPIIGHIINDAIRLDQPGKHELTIIRARPDKNNQIESVWYLRDAELIMEDIAMVTRILTGGQSEAIYVWLFDEQREGRLFLNSTAESHGLTVGKVFSAPFIKPNQKWMSSGPVSQIEDLYLTRVNRTGGIDIQVNAENIQNADDAHSGYPWIHHGHFGDILDNRHQLRNREAGQCRMWIRRAWVDREDNHQWVVLEGIE
ncbi:hypothetical protein GCK72_003754 [Caenorhabditis remanei]|uniref:Uncharacterized protein n=1 Tax=Caenorhabditis remanei TaxID=31234 RepID=A0A6A5H9V2_CAERE|nr:hypothetical protein GCK72_003754 [Caenorhabditis remanei]KAF1763809.1 hypothetical protein GCK72_003754 [Caenorhabditis remanei]